MYLSYRGLILKYNEINSVVKQNFLVFFIYCLRLVNYCKDLDIFIQNFILFFVWYVLVIFKVYDVKIIFLGLYR